MTGKPNICEVMRNWRWATRLDLKTAAAQIGVGESVLSRFERGENIGAETLTKVLRWLLTEAQAAPQTGPPIDGENQ